MTGLPHHRQYHSSDFVEPKRVRGMVTVIALALMSAIFIYAALIVGINIGREQERADQLRRKAADAADSVKPVYGQRLFTCSPEERHVYARVCMQRLRSNHTGGM